ncbi:hypothetical protein I7I50_12038 [Histoplasma capsulatum G186AR]|uniref:Uncharacterized protein n=1 Tax=Ajellomyces capsulatus TaxID=5037 RepID=A0A8H7Y8H7_AJECA|nr:hypothetical protein I7I52_11664 [Histoplasma capsulatum]QSS70412.1 hypothetical protein I7I50_12038 [Histoplasma capsulatum G186AR]
MMLPNVVYKGMGSTTAATAIFCEPFINFSSSDIYRKINSNLYIYNGGDPDARKDQLFISIIL